MAIATDTTIGAVALRVRDLDATRRFYERTIGLEPLGGHGPTVRLGAGDAAIVELVDSPAAPLRPSRSTGLFHLAILVPGRADLARALRRVIDSGWRLTGASDHLVSEALYLDDPEGNGIEIYRDRPREEWRHVDGELQMATLPLDLDGVSGELRHDDDVSGAMAPDTRIGHVHLQVADLAAAESFYVDTLGFEVTVRSYPGALFVAAGGYHHHVGLNTWASEGAPPPPVGCAGLDRFEVVLPADPELDALASRLSAAGVEAEQGSDGLSTADPSGNRLLIADTARRGLSADHPS